jgi:hypothetical protein
MSEEAEEDPEPKVKTTIIKIRRAAARKISEIIDRETARFIEDLPKTIKKKLDGVTAEAMGFQIDQYGDNWRVKGGGETIARYVSERAESMIKDFIGTLTVNLDAKKKKAIQRRFEERIAEEIDRQIQQRANETVKKILDKMVEGQVGVEVVDLSPLDEKSGANPKIGRREMEKILLRDLLNKHGVPSGFAGTFRIDDD